MKFSSMLAASALFGRHMVTDKINWMDAILTSIIAKNEILDQDGDIRKLLEGKNDREIEELKDYLDGELKKRNMSPEPVSQYLSRICESEPSDECESRGPLSEFWKGFKRGFSQ